MMQGWDGSYEGCGPAQVAVVSNAPTHHVRTPCGAADYQRGLLLEQMDVCVMSCSKAPFVLLEEETRVLSLNSHTPQ